MSTVPRSVADPTIGTPTFEPPVPQLDLITCFTVQLAGEPWQLGRTTDLGNRRIIPITGGHFRGPLLSGEILNNGADWQVVTVDGTTIVDTRYLLKTHDGSLIYLQTYGFRHGPPEVLAELAAGRIVEPNRYYFCINLRFETAAENYKWLNNVIAVGSAIRLPQAVVYDAYAIR